MVKLDYFLKMANGEIKFFWLVIQKAQETNKFRHFQNPKKKNESNYWVSFSPYFSGLGISVCFPGQGFVPSSDIGTGRVGLGTTMQSPILSHCLITRDYEKLAHF